MLTCLSKPTSGEAFVSGHSTASESAQVKRIVGISPQDTAVAGNLTVRENLRLIAGIYGFSRERTAQRIDDMTRLFRLEEVLDSRAKTLSGGWKRKLSIAMALISEPEVLFLDEPTLGLDVLARRELWSAVKSLRGKITIILTTHYMEEAANADYVVILDKGSIAAEGTPFELKNKYVQDTMSIYGVTEAQIKTLGIEYEEIRDGYRVRVKNTSEATELIAAHQELFHDYEVTKGGMDDVFLAVTGKRLGGEN